MLRGDGITRFCLVQTSRWYLRIKPLSAGPQLGNAVEKQLREFVGHLFG
ncbi:hypothetical protein BH09CHL1_BH09CHL1_18370 [soil metagenome]